MDHCLLLMSMNDVLDYYSSSYVVGYDIYLLENYLTYNMMNYLLMNDQYVGNHQGYAYYLKNMIVLSQMGSMLVNIDAVDMLVVHGVVYMNDKLVIYCCWMNIMYYLTGMSDVLMVY